MALVRRRPIVAALLTVACMLPAAACDKLPLPRRADGRALPESLPPVTPTPTTKHAKAKSAVAADPALAAGRFEQIRRDLRRLVAAEETFYAENGVYTDDLGRLGLTPADDSELRFLWATRGGWAVRATHAGVPGRDCIVYVGGERPAPTTVKDGRTGKAGVPVCDALPATGSADAPRAPATASAATPRRAPSAPAAPATASAATPRRAPSAPAAPAAETAPSGTAAAEAEADTGSALDAVSPSVQMRVDLRNLVRSQDTYFATQGIYSKRTEPFALQYLWHKGVSIRILSANNDAWSARATHAGRPGKSCVIWFGPVAQRPSTDAQRKVSDQAGTPVCDD